LLKNGTLNINKYINVARGFTLNFSIKNMTKGITIICNKLSINKINNGTPSYDMVFKEAVPSVAYFKTK
jgi:hypothetical protein